MMPILDPQMAAILKRAEDAKLKPYTEMTAQEARAEQEKRNAYWNENPGQIAKVEDCQIQGAFGKRHLRIFDDCPEAGVRPGIVYFHGGGWVIGSPRTHDVIGRAIACHTGLPVLSFDYVKAPEHPFPGPSDDCLAAFQAIQNRGEEFNIDTKRLGIAGDSAGAALALNVAMASCSTQSISSPVAQALVYPVASMSMDTKSHKTFGTEQYFLSTQTMRWFGEHYVQDAKHLGDPRLELITADLKGLPPTFISVAEFDPLCDEGDQLFDKLRADGVEVEYHLWRGVTHASLPMGRDLDQANRFLEEIGDFFKRRLASRV